MLWVLCFSHSWELTQNRSEWSGSSRNLIGAHRMLWYPELPLAYSFFFFFNLLMLSSLYVWFLVCNVEEKRIKCAVLCGLFSIRYSIKLRKKKKKRWKITRCSSVVFLSSLNGNKSHLLPSDISWNFASVCVREGGKSLFKIDLAPEDFGVYTIFFFHLK